jgi:chromosome segregation ATPase
MDSIKFAKILSLAASDNEAEAARALQAAKRMLITAGLDFVDVANLIATPANAPDTAIVDDLQEQLWRLTRENRLLKSENRRLRTESSVAKPTPANTTPVAEIERRLAVETAVRRRAEATCVQLAGQIAQLEEAQQVAAAETARMASELRRLKAAAAHLNGELERSETERYRLAAEAREWALAQIQRRQIDKARRMRSESVLAKPGDEQSVAEIERRLVAETAARRRAEAVCAQLANQIAQLEEARQAATAETGRVVADLRRLKATALHLNGELERSETECYRLAAEMRKQTLAEALYPMPRRSGRTQNHF